MYQIIYVSNVLSRSEYLSMLMPTFTRSRHSAVSHGACDLCHHRLFCVIFVSDIYPPPHIRPPFNPLLIHLVTSPRPQPCKQLSQSRRKTVRLKIICSDDLWIKSMGGRRLCYISTSISVILEFISIESNCVFKRFMGEKTR